MAEGHRSRHGGPHEVLDTVFDQPVDGAELEQLNDNAATVLVAAEADGTILGMAFADADGNLIDVSEKSGIPLTLTDAARDHVGIRAALPRDVCDWDDDLPTHANDSEALQAYSIPSASTPNTAPSRRCCAGPRYRRTRRDPGASIDEVTGRMAPPSLNDIAYQLEREGAEGTPVEVRPAVPVGAILPVDADGDADGVAVFVAEPTGRVLGWLVSAPDYDIDEGGNWTPVHSTVLDIAPPETDENVAVYIRDLALAATGCVAPVDERAIVEVLHDAIAGTTRALVDLEKGDYERVADLGD